MNKIKTATPPEQRSTTLKGELEQRLHTALADLKAELGEKKFAKRIKKAAELIGKDIKTAAKKVTAAKKTPAAQKAASPKTPKAPKAPKTPKVTKAPKTPKVTETPKATQAPKAVKIAKAAKTPLKK